MPSTRSTRYRSARTVTTAGSGEGTTWSSAGMLVGLAMLLRGHEAHDAFEVVHGAELDDYSSLAAAQLDLDPGVKGVRQALGEILETRRLYGFTSGAGPWLCWRGATGERDRLLRAAHRQPLGDDARREFLLRIWIVQSQ